ncbi:site-specific recombinase, phage integrase family [Acinetobacter haemolyticus ATCC 19194]|uniref:Site-specific recombinase, phage integrase family n=1 Tax=Acinetobacter haemolyticus ATCC 19194 TaxID=707232 RepID=D4XSQ4_ACIHA|nr:site-specific recombinase, phage integrase family [Acinetobacter haemolyticus ATCC 19194]
MERPKITPRLLVVLSKEELNAIFSHLNPEYLFKCQILYGTGMRLIEMYQLRIKDIDFGLNQITVRCTRQEISTCCNTICLVLAFPASHESTDPRSKIVRRHHQHEQALQRNFKTAVLKANISKPATLHTLRHSMLHIYYRQDKTFGQCNNF